jgi:hypothetical protein
MPGGTVGATYADAIIVALNFARDEPAIFMLTVPLTIIIVVIGVVRWNKFFFTDPTKRHGEQYQKESVSKAKFQRSLSFHYDA